MNGRDQNLGEKKKSLTKKNKRKTKAQEIKGIPLSAAKTVV